MVSMREQERGQCAICGRDCAVSYGNVSKHGYTVEQGYFSGACYGSGRAHYGLDAAKSVLAEFINSCEIYLKSLPDIIANLENDLVTGNKADKRYIKRNLIICKRDLVVIPLSVEALQERLENWVPKETYVTSVDSQGRTREQRIAIEQERENKKLAKIEADKIKKENAEKAEENRSKKAAEYEALIASDNYYRLFFEGQLIESWEASYEYEGDIYKQVAEKSKAYLIKLGRGGNYGYPEISMFYADGRTAADGKGKRFFQYLSHGTAKGYFERYGL